MSYKRSKDVAQAKFCHINLFIDRCPPRPQASEARSASPSRVSSPPRSLPGPSHAWKTQKITRVMQATGVKEIGLIFYYPLIEQKTKCTPKQIHVIVTAFVCLKYNSSRKSCRQYTLLTEPHEIIYPVQDRLTLWLADPNEMTAIGQRG